MDSRKKLLVFSFVVMRTKISYITKEGERHEK